MPSRPPYITGGLSAPDLVKLYEFVSGPGTDVPASCCCECGNVLELCTGKAKAPSPGDFSLCFRCSCLNVFDRELRLRKPTDDEIFAAAADPELQALRRGVEWFAARHKDKES
jgi:hypothetical protein